LVTETINCKYKIDTNLGAHVDRFWLVFKEIALQRYEHEYNSATNVDAIEPSLCTSSPVY